MATQKRNNTFNNESQEIIHITIEIYTPVEIEEYYIQNKYDPFPLLRTHKHNSYTPKIKQYINGISKLRNGKI